MTEEARVKRNQYFREYRKKNPEKIQAINAKYWASRAKKMAEEKQNAESDNRIGAEEKHGE